MGGGGWRHCLPSLPSPREGLPPVLTKLVARIQRGEFVDMAELLWDNIEVERRKTSQDQGTSCVSNPPTAEKSRISLGGSSVLGFIQVYIPVQYVGGVPSTCGSF